MFSLKRFLFVIFQRFVCIPQVYNNCSCVTDTKKSAATGACKSIQCVGMLAGYMVVASLAVFFASSCQAPVYVLLLRVLESSDKSLGIGLMAFLSRLLGKFEIYQACNNFSSMSALLVNKSVYSANHIYISGSCLKKIIPW